MAKKNFINKNQITSLSSTSMSYTTKEKKKKSKIEHPKKKKYENGHSKNKKNKKNLHFFKCLLLVGSFVIMKETIVLQSITNNTLESFVLQV
jgi:hypothetical protein